MAIKREKPEMEPEELPEPAPMPEVQPEDEGPRKKRRPTGPWHAPGDPRWKYGNG